MGEAQVSFTVNGRPVAFDGAPTVTLIHVLRNDVGCTSVRSGCGVDQCGACTVMVDGEAVSSCTRVVADVDGRSVTTLEGLGTKDRPHPLQRAFVAEQALQCGYCTPGMIVAAAALLDRTPDPADEDIRTALGAHLCRCGGYGRIIRAVRRAAMEADS
jgi:nicotinate dehydrogenase subunit A